MAISQNDKITAVGIFATLGLAFGVSMAIENRRHAGARMVAARAPSGDSLLNPERAAALQEERARSMRVLKGLVRDVEGKKSATLAIWEEKEEAARLARLNAEELAKAERDRERQAARTAKAEEEELKRLERAAKVEAKKARAEESSGAKFVWDGDKEILRRPGYLSSK